MDSEVFELNLTYVSQYDRQHTCINNTCLYSSKHVQRIRQRDVKKLTNMCRETDKHVQLETDKHVSTGRETDKHVSVEKLKNMRRETDKHVQVI